MAQEINSFEEWKALINQDKLVAIYYWAEWNDSSKALLPCIEKLSQEEYLTDVVFAKVDVEAAHDLSQAAGVGSLPIVQFYKNGQKIDEAIGVQPPALVSKLQQLL